MTINLNASEARKLGLQGKAINCRGKHSASAFLRLFLDGCEEHNLPTPQPEFRFLEERRWRWDFAWIIIPEWENRTWKDYKKIALEIDGGAYSQGRHTRGTGFINDIHKHNAGVLLGWKLIRCTPQMVEDGSIFSVLKEILK